MFRNLCSKQRNEVFDIINFILEYKNLFFHIIKDIETVVIGTDHEPHGDTVKTLHTVYPLVQRIQVQTVQHAHGDIEKDREVAMVLVDRSQVGVIVLERVPVRSGPDVFERLGRGIYAQDHYYFFEMVQVAPDLVRHGFGIVGDIYYGTVFRIALLYHRIQHIMMGNIQKRFSPQYHHMFKMRKVFGHDRFQAGTFDLDQGSVIITLGVLHSNGGAPIGTAGTTC
jgi:hypothetical protein